MMLGTKYNGQKILLRCGCSHDYTHDQRKYGYRRAEVLWEEEQNFCNKCELYGWRITGKTDEELNRREID